MDYLVSCNHLVKIVKVYMLPFCGEIKMNIYSYTAGVKSESGISVQLKIIDLTASKGKQCQPLGLKTR